jgi:DNA repair protein RadC
MPMKKQLINAVMEADSEIRFLDDVSEIELIYKSKIPTANRPQIRETSDAERIFRKYWDHRKIELVEEVYVLYLTKGNRVIGICPLFSGGIDGTVADSRVLLAGALLIKATAIIVAHNHPSGTCSPSAADEALTKELKSAGKLLHISLLDHIIITADNGFYSFSDHGLL